MTNVNHRSLAAVVFAVTASVSAPAVQAQESDWCRDERRDDRRYCELQEFTLPASGRLSVDARPNGGISVRSWNGDEVRVVAKIVARADDAASARDLVADVSIERSGTIRADGPRSRRDESWWVSYRIDVPASYDLDLESTNGGLSIEGVSGDIRLETTNGGLVLDGVGGDVQAHTTNGGVEVTLSGSRWEGRGLEAITTNGGIELGIPAAYSARLETGTRNGGFEIDFPITVSGRIGRTISTELGSGGAPITVRTTNGGVTVRRTG